MKRILNIIMMTMLALTTQAQQSITEFMGIPVDGSKTSLIKKLKNKGVVNMQCIMDNIDYNIKIYDHKGKVYRISLIEKKGTDDPCVAVKKYNDLVTRYKNDTRDYTEYESNDLIREANSQRYKRFISEGFYYAEFFQVCVPQLYSRRVSIKISDEDGDYRLVNSYYNIYNMPEGME